MITPEIREAILDIAVEDSYALSEIVARVQRERPDLSLRQARAVARSAVTEMIQAGLLAVTRLDTPNGPERNLDAGEAQVAIADDIAWLELPSWRSHRRVVATPLGKETYYRARKR